MNKAPNQNPTPKANLFETFASTISIAGASNTKTAATITPPKSEHAIKHAAIIVLNGNTRAAPSSHQPSKCGGYAQPTQDSTRKTTNNLTMGGVFCPQRHVPNPSQNWQSHSFVQNPKLIPLRSMPPKRHLTHCEPPPTRQGFSKSKEYKGTNLWSSEIFPWAFGIGSPWGSNMDSPCTHPNDLPILAVDVFQLFRDIKNFFPWKSQVIDQECLHNRCLRTKDKATDQLKSTEHHDGRYQPSPIRPARESSR